MTNRILHYQLPLSIFIFCISMLTIQAQTWTPQTSGTTTRLSDLSFISPTEGWATGDAGVLLKTTDAGVTWAPQSVGFTTNCAAVSFVSPTHGWVVDINTRIRATTDGGTTWSIQTSATNVNNADVFFVSQSVGWIINSNTIQKTTNGGATWALQTIGAGLTIYKSFFLSATHGWVIGLVAGASPAQPVVLTTTDGGTTWTTVTSSAIDRFLSDIHFTSTTNGYACTDLYVYRTTDGGATWTKMTNSFTSQGITGLFFRNATEGWIVAGQQGIIKATIDGGVTWRTELSGVTTGLNKIAVSGENGFIVGASGRIIATNNASNINIPLPTMLTPTVNQVMDNACDNGTTNTATWQLSWNAVSGATSYEASAVATTASTVLFSAETTNLNYTYSSTTAIPVQAYLCRARAKFANGAVSDWSPVAVTVEAINFDCQPPFVSNGTGGGSWSAGATWVGGVAPTTSNNDVIITAGDVVTIPTTGISICKTLTINGTLNNTVTGGTLQCVENMTVNPTGVYNCSNVVTVGLGGYFGGGVLGVGATIKSQGFYSSGSPANNKILSVNGGTFNGYVVLGGRLVATNSATVNLKGSEFTGWLDPNDATPQYLVEPDNTSTVSASEGQYVIKSNGTKPHFSPNVILSGASPSCASNKPSFITYNGSNNNCELGSVDRDQSIASISPFSPGFFSNINLKRLTMNSLNLNANYSSSLNISSTNSKFTTIFLPSVPTTLTLSGSFELINGCSSSVPTLSASANTSIDNTFGLKINVLDTAVLDLSAYAANQVFNVLGSFDIQSGKVVVKGGTLDLRNATLTGLDQNRYFITKNNNANTKFGSVILPGVSTTPRTFNLGLAIPNGANPPTNIYAPLSIVSTETSSTSTNISLSLQTLSSAANYTAPQIQWNITPLVPSSLNITFTWPASTEPANFAINRGLARIHHYNGTTWDEIPTSGLTTITNPDGSLSYSLTTTSPVTQFSPFMVGILSSVLSAELIDFKAKINGNKAELNWQTATETNVKNFEIEKSADGKIFDKINTVKANNTPSVYQAFDDNFSSAISPSGGRGIYYRLKINDLDGSSKYSKVVFLEKGSSKSIKIRRDTEGSVFVETDDKIETITVTNTIGQVVKTTKDKQFSMQVFTSGLYIVSVKTDKSYLSQKVFKD
jgi:photosystem II stability/assembly factor-like uncharacterized protein